MQHNLQADSIFYPSNSKSRNHLCLAWSLPILAPVGWRGWPWGQADPSHCGNFEAQAADLSRNLSSDVSRSHLCPCKGRGKPGVLKEDLFGHLKYQNWAKSEFEHSPSRFLVGFNVLLNSSLVDTWFAGYHGEKSNWGCQSSQYIWRLWFYFLSWHRVSWLRNELLSLIPCYILI